MNPRDQGRSLLQQWEAARPTNFYDDDVYLRFSLGRRLGAVRLAAVEPTRPLSEKERLWHEFVN